MTRRLEGTCAVAGCVALACAAFSGSPTWLGTALVLFVATAALSLSRG